MRSRRRRFWIDRDVQGALAGRVVFHWFLLFVISAMFLPIFRLMRAASFEASFSTLMQQAWYETAPVFVLMILLLPFFVWDTIKLSNRFAGPMYRIRTALSGLAAGKDVNPVRLRDDDFWKEAAHDFNVVRERLKSLEAGEENGAQSDDQPAVAGTTQLAATKV